MATWTPSAFIGDIRGRVGDQVFSFQKGTHYIKRHNANPDDPQTAKQQAVRGNLSNISAWWYTLGDTEQRMWEKFATLKKTHLSGYNAFVGVNMALYNSGIPSPPRRDHPPLTPATPRAVRDFQVTPDSPTQNTLSWSAPDDATLYVQAWRCFDWNYYGGYNQRYGILSATLSTALSYVHTHDTPSGARIWYHLRSIDLWGRKSPYTHTIKQVIPNP